MKPLLTAVLFFLSSSLFAQTKIESKKLGTLEFVELDYGLANVVHGTTVIDVKSPTRTRGWLEDYQIYKVTDSVPVAPKANFGVVYQINAKDTVDIVVQIEWIYPQKITNDKGETFKSIKYATQRPTNTPSASSYSLDEPYEMVKGKWTMNLYVEGKKVWSRGFVLY